MVKINGVNAEIVGDNQNTKIITPSINQILEKMDNNYKSINVGIQNQKQNKEQNGFGDALLNLFGVDSQPDLNSNNNANGNILLSILPLIASNKKAETLGLNSPIFKEIFKRIDNPMLQKIFEMIQKFSKVQNIPDKSEKNKEEIKIDSYTKTNDYESDMK